MLFNKEPIIRPIKKHVYLYMYVEKGKTEEMYMLLCLMIYFIVPTRFDFNIFLVLIQNYFIETLKSKRVGTIKQNKSSNISKYIFVPFYLFSI